MAMIQCPECGKEISDKSEKCIHCGYPISKTEESKENQEVKETKENKKIKKKNSKLSTVACILALFTVTIPIAFIIAIVDLCKKDKDKKHTGSWFAIIFSIIVFCAFSSNNKDDENTSSESKPITQQETQTDPNTFTYGNSTIKYLSHEIVNDDGEDVLVVYYEFTNNEDEPQSFSLFVTGKAYQNGVEVESPWTYTNDECKNSSKEIQKGTTIKVADSYIIENKDDDVTIEFRPFNIWSDKLLWSTNLKLQ